MRVLSHSNWFPEVFGILCGPERATITGPGFPGPVCFDLNRASLQAVLSRGGSLET